jgi:hypothetical protein
VFPRPTRCIPGRNRCADSRVQPVRDLGFELFGPGGIEDGTLAVPRHCGSESHGEVHGIRLGQNRHGSAVCCPGLGGIPESGPAEVPARHNDGGVVGAVISPALESVEKRHRINFTGRHGFRRVR